LSAASFAESNFINDDTVAADVPVGVPVGPSVPVAAAVRILCRLFDIDVFFQATQASVGLREAGCHDSHESRLRIAFPRLVFRCRVGRAPLAVAT